MLLYALRRSVELGRRSPVKLFKAFTLDGWRSFGMLIREGQRLGKKSKLSKQERARLREERRRGKFKSERWSHEGDLSRRRYDSYEDYVRHQKSKLEKLEHILVDEHDPRVGGFRKRFELLVELAPHASVLCLAARLGHEVEAFISLGHFAVGIDLNPGEGNRYVMSGDFHSLTFAPDSVDCVYTNSLDHVFELEKLMREVHRVLKPGGWFVTDLYPGYDEGFIAGEYEATHWATAKTFAEKLSAVSGLNLAATRDLTSLGVRNGLQCMLRKGLGTGGSK